MTQHIAKSVQKHMQTIPHGMQGRLFIVVDTSRQESYDKCICSMTQTESVSETATNQKKWGL